MARDIPQHALVVGGSACTTASAAQSEAAPHTNHRTHSNPTHFGSTSGMYSYQHSHSTNSLPLQPLLPLTTPQSVSCTTATMSHESTTACSPHSVSAPFNSVVCPQGTRQWYPAFFQAVHTVLSKSGCSLPHILIALLYVARLRQLVPANITGEGSEYRVFVSALILAQKFHSDDRYSNRAWAAITKLPLVEINTMEREFLLSIGNRLHVRDTDYSKWEETIRVLGQEHSVAQAAAHLHQLEFSHPSKYPQTNNGLLGVNRSASHMQYDNPLANEDDLFEADSVSSRRAHTFPRHSQGNLS
ncbi:hypothetical protein BATDEDRAFT_36449 [Batrachochytrium dendrobatidis JAM81]|uniref:Cyclin N-terminal domain-containing protein n=2 Tax=Batrachochytrium dendrobatidis TaxID=109871 RepID=F4NVI9_BATDJ|nr:uncharacterized protein BATDEDRAFT_36449 [Batrachochytrium dendrobatidis JAM81]EGF84101.1 hypothetical protein BATDEDRAFT_36449 [Batrachochytrium dendrobatidis JAM81]|eukprot:XP_006675872.1 hypothetical protein BATDEDRAFT_36449 [Batrachochytrium dendrobatidis JAM81]